MICPRKFKCHTQWIGRSASKKSMGRLNINQHLTASSNTNWQQIKWTISAFPAKHTHTHTPIIERHTHTQNKSEKERFRNKRLGAIGIFVLYNSIANQGPPKSKPHFRSTNVDIISFYKSVWQPNKTFRHDGNEMIYVQRLDRQ